MKARSLRAPDSGSYVPAISHPHVDHCQTETARSSDDE
jgi:hypothetical protein